MIAKLKEVLERVASWPEAAQEELARIAKEIEAEQLGVYYATGDELHDIDEVLVEVQHGEVATEEEVEAVFAKFRPA